jgi:hypothetical protein
MNETAENAIPIPSTSFNAAEITALSHLYRGEPYRSTVWRTRLDATTNWAVAATGLALSVAFSSPTASPLPRSGQRPTIARTATTEHRRFIFRGQKSKWRLRPGATFCQKSSSHTPHGLEAWRTASLTALRRGRLRRAPASVGLRCQRGRLAEYRGAPALAARLLGSSPSAERVAGLNSPVACKPRLCWKRVSASWLRGPQTPSEAPR